MAKKSISKVSDKLVKVNENFTVNMYDNGFMIEVGGRDKNEDWATVTLMVNSIDELIALVRESVEMDRDN